VTSPQRRLEAPHRRLEPRSRGAGGRGIRVVERAAVAVYIAVEWVVSRLPGPARWVIATASQAGYVIWPAKRRWSNANFGRVLGLDPGHPRVRRLAMSAYRAYARYIVEMMQLDGMDRDQASELVRSEDFDAVEPIWSRARGGLIYSLGHVGNAEAVAAGVAHRGWPINVVADDSTFPELFERFRRLREAWGVHVIPWRNLREIYAVLRRREMLGLLVDWGYRPDGIPVTLFGAWTCLPAGPATLAAKTGSIILPVAIRRDARGDHFRVELGEPIEVPSASAADLQRATQRMAHALEATIAAAPSQWYSFKPMWPPTEGEAAELERRAAAMLADEGESAASAAATVARTAPGEPAARGASEAPEE
jgi:lauroyl/myristoyl acyltransferase